jgi:hypothetical protein
MSYTIANYNGRQPNNTSYVKNFVAGSPPSPWTVVTYNNGTTTSYVISTSSSNVTSLYLPGSLYVDGSIVNPSDAYLKDNILEIPADKSDFVMNLKPSQFTFKSDPLKKVHYGFIAQEFETIFPELVTSKPGPIANIKAINYLEVIPLLVSKIQKMQNEIDKLKQQIDK